MSFFQKDAQKIFYSKTQGSYYNDYTFVNVEQLLN